MWFIVVSTLIDKKHASLLLSQILFLYYFCISSEFAKALKRKCDAHKLLICIMQGESVFSIVNKFLSLTSILW